MLSDRYTTQINQKIQIKYRLPVTNYTCNNQCTHHTGLVYAAHYDVFMMCLWQSNQKHTAQFTGVKTF